MSGRGLYSPACLAIAALFCVAWIPSFAAYWEVPEGESYDAPTTVVRETGTTRADLIAEGGYAAWVENATWSGLENRGDVTLIRYNDSDGNAPTLHSEPGWHPALDGAHLAWLADSTGTPGTFQIHLLDIKAGTT